MLAALNKMDQERARETREADGFANRAKSLKAMRAYMQEGGNNPPLLIINDSYQIPHHWRHDAEIRDAIHEVLDALGPDILMAAQMKMERQAKLHRTKADTIAAKIKNSIIDLPAPETTEA